MTCSPSLLRILGIKLANELIKPKTNPEQRLFQAIIVQALEDSLSGSVFKKETYWKHDAHKWFLGNCADFQEVCWSADLDPEFVRQEYIKLIKDKKIVFNMLQQSWINYRELYRLYRKANSKEERKRIRELIQIENNKRLA